MKTKLRTRLLILGIILFLIGLSGIVYEWFENIEELTIVHKKYPLGEEETIMNQEFDDITTLDINTHFYEIKFIPKDDIETMNVKVISSKNMQRFVETVEIKQSEQTLIINSKLHEGVVTKRPNKFPDELFEHSKNQIIYLKYISREYNNELLKKNIIIPEYKPEYRYKNTIEIEYPSNQNIEDIKIETHDVPITVKDVTHWQISKSYLLKILNGPEIEESNEETEEDETITF